MNQGELIFKRFDCCKNYLVTLLKDNIAFIFNLLIFLILILFKTTGNSNVCLHEDIFEMKLIFFRLILLFI